MPIPEQFKNRLKIPVVAAPMFLVSGVKLVTEACKAGIIGAFPALNQRTTEGFDEWLTEINKSLDESNAPYGVNLIVHKSNPRVQADLEICIKHKVPIVITSLGAVADLVQAVHSYGGVVFHDVTNIKHSKKAAKAGVDGLIAVCAGAGGHAGTTSPFSLVHEIREFFPKTILLAGCISNGQHVAAARLLGADLAYLGTRFIATTESQADQEYKQMILNSKSADIIYTPCVSGIPANFMKESLEKSGFDEKKLAEIDFGKKLSLNDEAKAWKTIWSAGQGVTSIKDIPSTAELVSRLDKEYKAAIQKEYSSLNI